MAELFQVNSFWTGRPLGELELMCLLSMQKQGHKVRIFSYGPIGPLPEGVELADANDIIPRRRFLFHASTGSPALGTDVFRFRLMQQQAGLWLDSDMLLLAPIAVTSGPVFGWQNRSLINCAVLHLPADSKSLSDLLAFTAEPYPIPPFYRPKKQALLRFRKAIGLPRHVTTMGWGVFGPRALTWFAQQSGEAEQARAQEVFYPVGSRTAHGPLMAGWDTESYLTDETIGLHLWNEALRKRSDLRPKNPKGTLLIEPESFVARYARRELGLTLKGD
ncbi:hypothetical protein [Devosia sp.]|uniref:hypothetical protein n=1 Tax=Devosia sp. TaxID=1871048 RepID=UPI003A9200AF